MMRRLIAALLLWLIPALHVPASDTGNRLAHLDDFCNPYYIGLDAPKLVTPQWVGQQGVEAVIVLSIDDMRSTPPYEKCLRPILERLKKIDGRAAVSIMTNTVDPADPQLARWLAEGVNIEAHTVTHPCPCLQGGDLAKAKQTYDACIDLLAKIPGGRTVAFRMPCCDSMNAVGPRFYTELFGKKTPGGKFLRVDSSVFLAFTADDPALPRQLVTDEEGRPRFTKYIPRDRNFVNYVENYPYPYVIDHKCWELPSAIPDDWLGINLQGNHNPLTVRDMKAAIDATVLGQGVFTLTFHPDRWIRNDQVIELIDHAVGRYGKKVKFLNFHEVHEALTKNLLGGRPLRADGGGDNGVRVLDLNNDGTMDVVIGNEKVRQTRVWSPVTRTWSVKDFPVEIVTVDARGNRRTSGVRFGVLQENGYASVLVRNEKVAGLWHFDGRRWAEVPGGLKGLELNGPVQTSAGGRDRGVRLRDLDLDGICELIVGNPKQQGVFRWSTDRNNWVRLPFTLPPRTAIVDEAGRDAGLRFVDVDEDGHADVVFSNARRYSLHLFTSIADGWPRKILAADRSQGDAIPMIVRADGTNNGAWFAYRHMYVQNEDTGAKLKNHIDSRSYTQLLDVDIEPPARSPEGSLHSLIPRPGFKAELMAAEPWFRPATMQTGPDGALWVTDMYRFVIEHPEWIVPELTNKLELRRFSDKGRIYRIYPVDKKPRLIPRLDKLDTAGLVAALDSPNGWQRDMAQQMLLWRLGRSPEASRSRAPLGSAPPRNSASNAAKRSFADPSSQAGAWELAVKLLEKMVAECKRPLARLHALCTLDGLEALRPEIVIRGLADEHPGVRRHAVRLILPVLPSHRLEACATTPCSANP